MNRQSEIALNGHAPLFAEAREIFERVEARRGSSGSLT